MRKFIKETTWQVYKRWVGRVGGRRRETFTKNKRSESASDRAWSTVYGIIQIIRWTLNYPARNVNRYRLLELIVIMLMSPRVRGEGGGITYIIGRARGCSRVGWWRHNLGCTHMYGGCSSLVPREVSVFTSKTEALPEETFSTGRPR